MEELQTLGPRKEGLACVSRVGCPAARPPLAKSPALLGPLEGRAPRGEEGSVPA